MRAQPRHLVGAAHPAEGLSYLGLLKTEILALIGRSYCELSRHEIQSALSNLLELAKVFDSSSALLLAGIGMIVTQGARSFKQPSIAVPSQPPPVIATS